MQNLRQRIESEYSQAPESYPHPPKNKGDEGRGNGEEIHHGVELEHEDQLVIGGDEPHEEVSHEQNIQDEIKLKEKSKPCFKGLILPSKLPDTR